MKMPLSQIIVDSQIQPRATLNEDAIADYQREYESARDEGRETRLPAIRVFLEKREFEPDVYYLTRGFHRVTAAQRAKLTELDCEVIEGDRRKAILDAIGSNRDNGVRMTNEDKRKAVLTLLDDEEWGKWTQQKIADEAGVHLSTVRNILAERKQQEKGNLPIVACSSQEGEKTVECEFPAVETHDEGNDQSEHAPQQKKKKGVKGSLKEKGTKEQQLAEMMEQVPRDRLEKLRQIKADSAEIKCLIENDRNFDEQRQIIDLVDGVEVKTLASALGKWDKPVSFKPQVDEDTERAIAMLRGLKKTIDTNRVTIDKIVELLGKKPTPDYSKIALDELDKAGQAIAKWAKVAGK
jgi:hypothetical protein